MPSTLHFSNKFAKRMKVLSVLIGLAITITMPIIYFVISWQEFHYHALIRSEEFARKVRRSIQDNPDLWYYNATKFIEITEEFNVHKEIGAVRILDEDSNLLFEQVLNRDVRLTYSFSNPLKYNNEVHGFIEMRESIEPLVLGTVKLIAIFAILGIAIGTVMYRYSVRIVRIAEKDVIYAEQSRRQAERELARLDRLRIVGEMAAAIGHEVRNPMTTVSGYLQLFMQKKELASFASQFQLLIDELDRANDIITEYLSMAHNKAVKKKECHLKYLIEELQPLIESKALLRGLSVELALNNVPYIYADEQEIKQLILNITQNGLEAMEAGGCLSIKTDVEDNDIRLIIIDQGKGFDTDILPKFGTPFFTTKETGTGLGLAICYSIAHRHQARIDFKRAEGCTICIIRFPTYALPEDPIEEA